MRRARKFMRWLSVILPAALALSWTPATLAAQPTLISLSPGSAIAGGARFTLTVNGTGFTSDSMAALDGVALATVYKSATQLEAAIPTSLIASPCTITITVTTDGIVATVPVTGGSILTIDPPSAIPGSGQTSAVVDRAVPLKMSDAKSGSTSTWDAVAPATLKSAGEFDNLGRRRFGRKQPWTVPGSRKRE